MNRRHSSISPKKQLLEGFYSPLIFLKIVDYCLDARGQAGLVFNAGEEKLASSPYSIGNCIGIIYTRESVIRSLFFKALVF